MKIVIIGSGVVGQTTGVSLLQRRHEVIFHDIDKRILQNLESKGHKVIDDLSKLRSNPAPSISMVCVPTPTTDGRMEKRNLELAIKEIGNFLQRTEQYHVVVIRSTVLPSTTRIQIIPLLEKCSGKNVGKDFGVCINPEFFRQTSALEDSLHPWRVVIGEYDKRSGDVLECLYSDLDAPVFRTDLDTAEMIKYVANTFLATKISFFNEIYLICKKLGLDAHLIAKAVAQDPRIGPYGIFGGRPFEGSCLPKDLEAFISFVSDENMKVRLLKAVQFINRMMKKRSLKGNS